MVQIATGLWYDHSKSLALAPTLTLPLSSSYLLVSGLTLLVTIAGTSFWAITAYLLHRWKAQRTASVIDLQHRVTLRNSSTALRTLWELVKIHHAWAKKPTKGLLPRTLSVAIPAFVITVGFAVASLFASAVGNKTYGAVAARLRPDNCGFWDFDLTTNEGVAAFNSKALNDTIQARSYAATFYANSTSSSARPVFVQATLPYTTDGSAACPIPAAERCILGANGAFSVTSGLLDSHEMLGINAKPDDRVQVQMSLTCSPVNVSDLATATPNGDSVTARFYLGPIDGIQNETERYNSAIANNTGLGYTVSTAFKLGRAELITSSTGWLPIPDFSRDDADVSVHFMNQNDVRYIGPVHDPWFSADGTRNFTIEGVLLTQSDSLVRTMACADQYMLCNPSTSICTPLSGLVTVMLTGVNLNTLGFNNAQMATTGRIVQALGHAGAGQIVSLLGARALWANDKLVGAVSSVLPDNQWQIEVLGWFQTSLAKLQASIAEFASNTAGLSPYSTISLEGAERSNETVAKALRDQCDDQLVQAVGEVQNFSLVGVLVIVCLSIVIISLDWSLEWLFDRFGRPDSAARSARQADSTLHLLHKASVSEMGAGQGWQFGKWGVPVSDSDELLPVFQVLGKGAGEKGLENERGERRESVSEPEEPAAPSGGTAA